MSFKLSKISRVRKLDDKMVSFSRELETMKKKQIKLWK